MGHGGEWFVSGQDVVMENFQLGVDYSIDCLLQSLRANPNISLTVKE